MPKNEQKISSGRGQGRLSASRQQAAQGEDLKQVDIGHRRVNPVGTERHRVNIAQR